jgi:rubrerythrin
LLAPYSCGTPLTDCSPAIYDLAQSAAACDPSDSGALDAATCESLCPNWYGGSNACVVFDDDAGGHVTCTYRCPGGRRPEGLVDAAADSYPSAVATFLAGMAYLEAASVPAFERLARELEAHGAPRRLRTASRRAAQDERRHARVMRRLAEREGARVAPATVEPRPVRSLQAIAIENAVEGCVCETFGAAVAAIQAQRAGDPAVRRAMKGIARDEASHAELSWAVARWLERRLTKAQRRRVRSARSQAVAQLLDSAPRKIDEAARSRLGVPDGGQVVALLRELDVALWSHDV